MQACGYQNLDAPYLSRWKHMHTFAIKQNFDFILESRWRSHACIWSAAAHAHFVFTIQRKHVFGSYATTRAQRHAVEADRLVGVGRAVSGYCGSDRSIADRKPADFAGDGNVGL